MVKSLIASLTLVLSIACASFKPLPAVILQKGETDCAIATIAMASHLPYEKVMADAKALGITVDNGLDPLEFTRLTQKEKLQLEVLSKEPELGEIEAILVIAFPNGDIHAVYCDHGWVLDPEVVTPIPWSVVNGQVVSVFKVVR